MSLAVPTPHIEAKKGDIAPTVLMPGDPLRAQFIVEKFLTNAVQYNGVRGMLGYTGTYKGVRVSVQGSGMGMPSMGIYSYELFHGYDVQNIIRVGTTGAIHPDLRIKDIVIAQGACTNSNYGGAALNLPGLYAPIASYSLLEGAVRQTKKKNLKYMVGNVLSSDAFYSDNKDAMGQWRDMGVLAVEMEAASLYMNAARAGRNALCIVTVSDCIFAGEAASSQERQTGYTDMMEIALDTVAELA